MRSSLLLCTALGAMVLAGTSVCSAQTLPTPRAGSQLPTVTTPNYPVPPAAENNVGRGGTMGTNSVLGTTGAPAPGTGGGSFPPPGAPGVLEGSGPGASAGHASGGE